MSKKLIFFLSAIILIGLFFYSVSDILFPFVVGLLIAYLFDPVADWLQNKGIGRGIASAIVVLSFFFVLIAAIIFLGPILAEQIKSMAENIPKYWEEIQYEILPRIESYVEDIDPAIVENAKAQAQEKPGYIASVLSKFTGNILNSSLWLFNIISLLALTPFIAFYILRDWDKFIAKIDNLLPRDYEPKIRAQAQKIDNTISAFLRGQLNVCLILGTFYSIALSIHGLNFGFAIGFLSGMLCFIPYLGTVIGIFIGVAVALVQYGDDYTQIAIVAAIYGVGQIAEGNFLTPKIVGDKVGVHPAWLIFGMLSGGALLGFVGVLISVPLTATIGVLVKFALEEYENSDFYKKSVIGKKKPTSKKETQSYEQVMNQAIFNFPSVNDYSLENFSVSKSNQDAYKYISNFPWANYAVNIHGPNSSGKTYLGKIASELNPVKVEHLDDITSDYDEEKLLSKLNLIKENDKFIVITSLEPLSKMGFKLPDLTSRISAIDEVAINSPDSELIYILLARHFKARQLNVSDEVLNFMATRMERDFTSIHKLVEDIDKLSLQEKRDITIPLIKKIIA